MHNRSGMIIRKIAIIMFAAVSLMLVCLLSGCSVKEVLDPVFSKDAEIEEENTEVTKENTLISAQVNDAQGNSLTKPNGEAMTVLVAYETATGGEPRINENGELVTYPLGEIATYTPGAAKELSDGTYETYAGGEPVTDIFGATMLDASGNDVTRAAGETVTYGEDEIIYDESGERVTYSGEYCTYAAGEDMYETDGERATYPVTIARNRDGEVVTDEAGSPVLSQIELVTDAAGNPVIEENGEAATKQLDPVPPQVIVEEPVQEGQCYINSITSKYVYFSAPEVNAADIALVADEGVDPYQYAEESGDGTVQNLQLEMLGSDLPYLDLRIDPEGYVFFVLKDTDQVLTLAGDIRDGVNVLYKTVEQTIYPQYKYWDDPVYTVADNQKWVIKDEGNGAYSIRSAVDESYALTVDDQYGTQYANIMLWKYDGRDTQKFNISYETPKVEQYIEPGTYSIRSGLTDWQLITLDDQDYSSGSSVYLYSSYNGDGQRYTITYDEYGLATITHGDSDSNLVLSLSYGEAADGSGIIQYENENANWQKWIIDKAEGDCYYIRSASNVSEVWTLSNVDFTQNDNGIITMWNKDIYAQYWGFEKEALPSHWDFEYMDDYVQNFSSMTEYLLVIDSNTNHVGVYQGSKGNWKCINFWDCVTGKESTPTIKGEFTVYTKLPSFDGNMDSPAWYTCYYATGFYPQYFFHTIIYYQGTWDIMDASMGWNLSHGCVRLMTDNAKWIYDTIPLNTKVISY